MEKKSLGRGPPGTWYLIPPGIRRVHVNEEQMKFSSWVYVNEVKSTVYPNRYCAYDSQAPKQSLRLKILTLLLEDKQPFIIASWILPPSV